jgi:membrane-associated protease RseP (regulator of RpoE activity)
MGQPRRIPVPGQLFAGSHSKRSARCGIAELRMLLRIKSLITTFKSNLSGRFGIVALLLAPMLSPGAEDPAPAVLPPVNVIETVLSVKVSTEYVRMNSGQPFATRMVVRSVKTPSIGQRAGLKNGMEIVAIQGQRIAGLSQTAVEQLLVQPVKDSVLLLVRRSWFRKPEEIRLSVGEIADPR